MKKINQVEILHWAKTKHAVNPKYVHRSLKDKDFVLLCGILLKTKQIGSVVSVKGLVEEFIKEYGIEYLPQSFNGEVVDLTPLFNTHPETDSGFIEVSLYHILLNQWCRPTRENVRVLKRHLKELGHEITEKHTAHSKTRKKEPHLKLRPNYDLSLPHTLKRYTKPIKWYKSISSWVYLNQPPLSLEGEEYKIKEIGGRWEAYFNQRFIELFEMSEMMYLHQHPQVRGCYENAPPVLTLCDLTLRDVFSETLIRAWVDILLKHKDLELYKEDPLSVKAITFLDAICDDVRGKLSKTTLNRRNLVTLSAVQGWTSIIVICYVNDILRDYKSLL